MMKLKARTQILSIDRGRELSAHDVTIVSGGSGIEPPGCGTVPRVRIPLPTPPRR